MYIAIVADNVADRKQSERLMNRANTALAPSIGTLYVSSFGDESSFLHECMKFDLFIIDYDNDPERSLSTVSKLKEMCAPGISVILKPAEQPFSYETAIKGIYTLDKPILTAPLHKLIIDVYNEVEEKKKQVKLVELRGENGTHYIPKDDIMYIKIDDAKHTVNYHIATGEVIELSGTLSDVDKAVGIYDEFELKLRNVCINTEHIKEENKKSILMSDGECFQYPFIHRFFK